MLNVVTGANGYTGKYIARRLLDAGETVINLTGHPDRPSPFGERVRSLPFHFENPGALTESLAGADTLYNTYWVRFTHGGASFDAAVENTKVLFHAAREAGVRRIVHTSITNPSLGSPLPYFHGKAVLEKALMESGLSYAILRPTVLFGREDILINNIAWFLRKYPVFAVAGDGRYKLQPVFVEDYAELAVTAGHAAENQVFDAVGPETFDYDGLVRLIGETVKSRARIAHVTPGLALFLAGILGRFVSDVVLTREEIDGLMAGLLVSNQSPAGKTRLSDWLRANDATLGAGYSSELARHFA